MGGFMDKINNFRKGVKSTFIEVIQTIPWLVALVSIGYLVTIGIPHLYPWMGIQ